MQCIDRDVIEGTEQEKGDRKGKDSQSTPNDESRGAVVNVSRVCPVFVHAAHASIFVLPLAGLSNICMRANATHLLHARHRTHERCTTQYSRWSDTWALWTARRSQTLQLLKFPWRTTMWTIPWRSEIRGIDCPRPAAMFPKSQRFHWVHKSCIPGRREFTVNTDVSALVGSSDRQGGLVGNVTVRILVWLNK